MSAPITQAHYDLRRQVLFSAPDDGAQLIADSEAEAVQTAMIREYGNLCATNESLAKECDRLRHEVADANAQAERAEEIAGRYGKRSLELEAELAAERARRDDLIADINDACITLASAKDDCDDYALLNTGFKLTAVRDVLIQYIPPAEMEEDK
jgi:hypothetical protein